MTQKTFWHKLFNVDPIFEADADEYQVDAARTSNYDFASIAGRLNDDNIKRVNHAMLGLMDEIGELSKTFKGFLYNGKELDVVNVEEEIGDIFWFLAEACNALDLSFSEIMIKNIEKLKVRYPDEFSDEQSQNRDIEAERKVLEKEE